MDLELYINGEFIEIDSSIISPLTYSIADIKNPNKRSRNRSKTISILGTQNNLRAMFSAYNISLEDSGIGFNFDPNGELTARIVRDGYVIFNGVANFIEVNIKDGVKMFDFQLFGNSVGLFEQLGDRTLQDLGWSEYDHALTIANLELSWDTSVVKNGSPTSNFNAGLPLGFGYLYGLVNWGYATLETEPKTNELIPQFYIKEILEKCFAVGGYTITGSWIDLPLTRRTVISKGGGERITLQGAEITARRVNYSIAGSVTKSVSFYSKIVYANNTRYSYSKGATYDVGDITPLSTTIVNDSRTQFDETNGRATIGSTGTYNININIDLDYTLAFVGGSPTSAISMSGLTVRIIKNNAVIRTQFIKLSIGASINEVINITNQTFISSGDVIRFDILETLKGYSYVSSGSPPTLDVNWLINSASFDITSIDSIILEGDTVEVGRWVPEMKCRDFVNSIITMFNLYLSDPTDDNEIRIETFKDYYDDTSDAENYTLKLDNSKKVTIRSNAGIEGKIYKFRFAEDRDAMKEHYFQRWGIDYGDLDYSVPSTFKKGDKEYKVDFAQTVPIQVGNLVIPQVITRDSTTNLVSPYKGKPRIFIYNGLQTGAWTLKNSTTGAGTSESEYPQLHHSDDIASPTFDLNFGVPIEVYFTATSFTNANLFGEFYETQIRELTSVDSKFLIAYFKLLSQDLQGDFMARLVNIKGSVFRKNIITDYDSTGNETTRMELIKVRKADSRRSTLTLYDGGSISDDIIIGNIPQNPTDSTASDMTVSNNVGTLLVDTSGGDVTVTLPNTLSIGQPITIKKMSSANNLIIQGYASGGSNTAIDGNTSGITLTTQYDKREIQLTESDNFITV